MLDNSKELPVAQIPGWACVAIGVGFIALLAGAIVIVRFLSGG
jgi:hypothetical protein